MQSTDIKKVASFLRERMIVNLALAFIFSGGYLFKKNEFMSTFGLVLAGLITYEIIFADKVARMLLSDIEGG